MRGAGEAVCLVACASPASGLVEIRIFAANPALVRMGKRLVLERKTLTVDADDDQRYNE